MGRGSSGSGESLGNGGGNDVKILNEDDMLSSRNPNNQNEIDQVLTVGKNMVDKYGKSGVLEGSFKIATLGEPDASHTLGYYSPGNGGISMNANFMNSKKIDRTYDRSVKQGYHPSRGNKTGAEAVAAHEYGHALADAVGRKMGINNLDKASESIVKDAMRSMGKRNVNKGSKDFASKISGYAKESWAECVAEAVSDFYCNGSKAKRESKAIVKQIDKHLLGK